MKTPVGFALLSTLLWLTNIAQAVHIIVNFGDSYSSTFFDPEGILPSVENPMGNPPPPGKTWSGGANWPEQVLSFAPKNTLNYNFAYGGMVVDNALLPRNGPDYFDQIEEFEKLFLNNESVKWDPKSTVFATWFGVNDVSAWAGLFNISLGLNEDLDSYARGLDRLYADGARKFIILTAPPLLRTPNWHQKSKVKRFLQQKKTLARAIPAWNSGLQQRASAFLVAHPDSELEIVDTASIFNNVLDNYRQYNVPNAMCHNRDGTSCMWFDPYHPSTYIQKAVGEYVYSVLDEKMDLFVPEVTSTPTPTPTPAPSLEPPATPRPATNHS